MPKGKLKHRENGRINTRTPALLQQPGVWQSLARSDRMSDRTCSIDGCKNKHIAKDFCEKHYRRWKKYGDPSISKLYYDAEESFANRTMPSGSCIIWTARTDPQGYGFMKVNGADVGAHRYAWERVNGPIPDGMRIDHTCFNPTCVKVSHLRLATASQNGSYLTGARDGSASGIRNVHKHGDGWQVSVGKDRKSHYFGKFETIDEAAEVAEQARQELFGEFAGRG